MNHVGIGYDVHPLSPGRDLILGGVRIPHAAGLVGHSDADVLMHAICDAVLGALGERDIGHFFPNTDPRWAGADSAGFVRHAVALAAAAGLRVGNCDVTVLAERPRLGACKARMRVRIAELLGVEESGGRGAHLRPQPRHFLL